MRKTSSRKPKHKKIAVLGFGSEGKSLLKFLKKRGVARNIARVHTDEIWILDKNKGIKIPKGIKAQLGKGYLNNLKKFDIIFRSPGIPYMLPELCRARCRGTQVSSATKLFFETIRGPARNLRGLTQKHETVIIGVTGTKGKSTTATLIYKILKDSGFKTTLAGNVGKPMLDIINKVKKTDFAVLELSSFQLQDSQISPHIAVVLDIFPDHLDKHKSLREYYGSKANIGRFQKKNDAIFYFAGNKLSRTIAFKSPAKKIPVTAPPNLLRNKIMAESVCLYLKCPKKTIRETIKNFRGLEHRLELVRSIKIAPQINAEKYADKRRKNPRKPASIPRKSASVNFINDSAATNPKATAMAIKSLSHTAKPMSLILIAGGRDKNLSYAPLAKEVKSSKCIKAVILFGENRKRIKKILKAGKQETGDKKKSIKIFETADLDKAVNIAYKSAKLLVPSSYSLVTVLFSPASTSLDSFRNYSDRGEQFKKEVRKLNF